MTNLTIFNFEDNEIRFVDGLPVANDVAKVLGYADVSATISKKVFPDNKGLAKIETPGGMQSITVLKEAGIYQLIFSSKLSHAQKFQQWVFNEVLPSIRKTGSYSVDPQLEAQNKQLEAIIEENEPLVSFAKEVQGSADLIDFSEYSKIINTGRNTLMKELRNLNILMKKSTLPYQKYIDSGYFKVSQDISGQRLARSAKITGKGQIWLHKKIRKFILDAQISDRFKCL